MTDKIPTSTIGLLSTILPAYYSESQIRSRFYTASAPPNVYGRNKSELIINWLEEINRSNEMPLQTLGLVIQEYMEIEFVPW